MRARWKAVAMQIGLLCAFERLAVACPFCGGKGASGLLENFLIVAGLCLGVRAMLRAAKQRRLREQSAKPESEGERSTTARA